MSDTTIALAISGKPTPLVITRAEFRQHDSKHVLALVDLQLEARSHPAAAELTPVTVDWGRVNERERFYGYVHHSQVIAEHGRRTLRYVLIGTSLPMNVVRTRSWKNTTASALARQVFAEHRLRAVVTPHGRHLDFWAQAGVSDFNMLVALAKETGFRLWIDGATGFFVDPTVLLKGPQAASLPVFVQNQQSGFPDTLSSMKITSGTMVPRGDDNQTVASSSIYGLDKRSGGVIRATSLNPASAFGTILSRQVDNFADAQAIADANGLGNRNWITAEATVQGTVLAQPGRLAGFQGTALPSDRTGLWFIEGARHVIVKNAKSRRMDYTTTLSVARDTDTNVTIRAVANLTKNRETIPATLRNGKTWEASLLEQINVG